MGVVRLFKAGIIKVFHYFQDQVIKRLPIYYTHIDKLPIEKWFKLQDGKYDALYKIRLFERIPDFFRQIEYDMNFQFERVSLEHINKYKDIIMMESLAALYNDKVRKFHADSMRKELINQLKKDNSGERLTMNSMFNYIESTLNCFGTLHGKMKTSRVFSLYNLAYDKNKPLLNKVS